MPRPIRGLVAIAEFGSKFEADAAVALLLSEGIEATPSYDPAMTSMIVRHMATDRTFEVLVDEANAEQAVVVLEALEGELPPEFTEPFDLEPPTAGRRNDRRSALLVIAAVLVAATLATILVMTAVS